MAKARRKDTDQDVPHIVDREAVEPNCPRCKKQDFSVVQKKIGTASGSFIYCRSCGCIVGWSSNQK